MALTLRMYDYRWSTACYKSLYCCRKSLGGKLLHKIKKTKSMLKGPVICFLMEGGMKGGSTPLCTP